MASSPLVFCADIGTSSLKAAFIDAHGQERAFARVPYAGKSSAGAGFGAVLSGEWEAALFRAAEVLFSRSPDGKPEALCISGNGPSLVPVTIGGEELRPLHWHQGGSGGTGAPSLFLPHVIRFRDERPGEYEKTRYLFSAQEWLAYRLGAEAVTVLPAPAYEPYYWDGPQCEAAGLDRGKFPPLVSLGSPIGRLSPEAARRLHLPAGIPIIAGGPDFIMALIGAGAVRPGIVCDRAGTSEGINVCSDVPAAPGDLRVLPHVREGLWNVSAILPRSGYFFEWFRTLTGQKNRSYEAMLEEIIPPGEQKGALFFPPLVPLDQAGPGEALIAAPGLTSRAELGRGVVEAIGFMVRGALETLNRRGFPVREMRLSGGQGKNARWNQLKADMSGVTLLVPEVRDAELAGDAILAAIALGEAADLDEAVRKMVHIKERYVPNPEAVPVYEEKFRVYEELQRKIRGLF